MLISYGPRCSWRGNRVCHCLHLHLTFPYPRSLYETLFCTTVDHKGNAAIFSLHWSSKLNGHGRVESCRQDSGGVCCDSTTSNLPHERTRRHTMKQTDKLLQFSAFCKAVVDKIRHVKEFSPAFS
jgi:hypothetical protein